jgi:DNA-binding CsgD family transcriptional regulator
MQILLLADNSPVKIAVTVFLDSCPNIQSIDLCLEDTAYVDIDRVDGAIYIDPEPNLQIVDRLRQTSRLLILIATRDEQSDLFIPAGAFTKSHTAIDAIHNIKNVLQPPARPSELANLTPRQTEILALMLGGCTKGEILARLDICPRTYQIQLGKIRMLFGVANNERLIAKLHFSRTANHILQNCAVKTAMLAVFSKFII